MAEAKLHKKNSKTTKKVQVISSANKANGGFLLGEHFQFSLQPEEVNSDRPEMRLQMENSKRNVDILWSGLNFLKGNRYEIKEEDKKEGTNTSSNQERYFTDKSTIRCRKCRELGHMSMSCPNEAILDRVCIYCGLHGHEQFDCPKRLCFKCNSPGHKASECDKRNPKCCFSCNKPGHKADECMIKPPAITAKEMQKMVCMQCRRKGHIMCEANEKLNIDWGVIKEYKEAKVMMLKRLQCANEDINLIGDGLRVEDDIEMNVESKKVKVKDFSELKKGKKKYKKTEKESLKIYCCYCGDQHLDEYCTKRRHNSNSAHPHEMSRRMFDNHTQEQYHSREKTYTKQKEKKPKVTKRKHGDSFDAYNEIVLDQLTKGNKRKRVIF